MTESAIDTYLICLLIKFGSSIRNKNKLMLKYGLVVIVNDHFSLDKLNGTINQIKRFPCFRIISNRLLQFFGSVGLEGLHCIFKISYKQRIIEICCILDFKGVRMSIYGKPNNYYYHFFRKAE